MLQTFSSDQQSTHSSLCEVLQCASVTLMSEAKASSIGDAAVSTGTCILSAHGKKRDVRCFIRLSSVSVDVPVVMLTCCSIAVVADG